MSAQTTWRPWPFDSETAPRNLQLLNLVVTAYETGCNVKPKSATRLPSRQLECIRGNIRNSIEALGLTEKLGVKQRVSATYQLTIYHRNRHAH